MQGFPAAGDDAHRLLAEKERPRQPHCLRRHRVPAGLEFHHRCRANVHWIAQLELLTRHLQRSQACALSGKSVRRDFVGRPRRPLEVHFVVPRLELAPQVVLVDEAARLEEAALHPADKILDRAFLLRLVRPAQLDAHAELADDGHEG
jgi:hypothetical protein